MVDAAFGFELKELDYWMIKRKDGETVKYVLSANNHTHTQSPPKAPSQASAGYSGYAAGNWFGGSAIRACHHDGADLIYRANGINLYIADAAGCRRNHGLHDFTLDCGDILNVGTEPRPTSDYSGVLLGDEELVIALDDYVEDASQPSRILQIDWDDRKRPWVSPEFWPALAKLLSGDVLCACQGGHGRSGTALTSLIMCLNPEYSAKDAIVHLRAMHCPRAIESSEQHEYLDLVAHALGREEDAKQVHLIKSFRDEFLKMSHPSAKKWQDTLLARQTKKGV